MYRPKNLNCYIYLRKSRKDIEEERKSIQDGEQYDTLERHRRQLMSLVKKEEHTLIESPYEEVVSGESIIERPEIQRLIRNLESGAADAVIVMDIDRLGRGDMLDQGMLDRAFRYSGTKIITPTEVYDPEDEAWELVFGVKSLVARQELKAITRRLQGGRRDAATRGRSVSKKPPYGYLRDENLQLYPDPDTSWVVKEIFKMMVSGLGRVEVCNVLREKYKVPSPSGSDHWNPSTVSSIVKNEVYLGHIIWGKITYKKVNGKYKRTKVPPEMWHRKDNAHEPLVTQELFNQANEVHSGRWRAPSKRKTKLSNPFAGLLKCEFCGRTMVYYWHKNKPNAYLRCSYSSCKDRQKGVILSLVEERMLDGLKEIVDVFEAKENEKNLDDQNTVVSIREKALEKQKKKLADLNKQKSNLHDFLEKGVYDIDTFLERQNVISERINDTQSAINQLESEIQYYSDQKKKQNEYVPEIKKVISAYQEVDDPEKKNRLLKSILEKATYRREKEWMEVDHFVLQLYPKF